jgi:8-oxo-dGTP diphosphatase
MAMNLPSPVLRLLGQVVKHPFGDRVFRIGVRVFAPRQQVGVVTVCVDPTDHVIILHHVFHPREPWAIPGGWLEPDEAPEDCARRELLEETGLAVEVHGVVASFPSKDPRHLVIVTLATVDEVTPALTLQATEINDGGWFPLSDLPPDLARVSAGAIERARPSLQRLRSE